MRSTAFVAPVTSVRIDSTAFSIADANFSPAVRVSSKSLPSRFVSRAAACRLACAFFVAFMLLRDGPKGTVALFRGMGWPGLAVALCFATASISFVTAITYTTVAKVVLVGAAVPLVAALIGRLALGTRVSAGTWLAIGAVIAGVGVMVSGSSLADGSLTGNALALLMTVAFALSIVITRQYSGVRMTPAVCTGTVIAAVVAGLSAGALEVGARDLGFLFAFGALNLGLGTALFVTGARLLPAALTALIGTLETILSPAWVWMFHGEVPSGRTILGGAIVVTALVVHILSEARRTSAPSVPTTPAP